MDSRFRPAEVALNAGDVDRVTELLRGEPELATARSTRNHPTLLQCLVLVNPPPVALEQLIRLLADYGAELTGPLIAATCIDNRRAMSVLLDLGASIEGNGRWSPLEEALYWGFEASVQLLLERGAAVDNLRKAAGLGRTDLFSGFFDESGAPTAAAGKIASPFDKLPIAETIRRDPQELVNNALIYAAAWGRDDAVEELLKRGAQINAIPAGFDFAGTALHYAALRGRREMVDRLLRHGADPAARDAKINHLPEEWAAHDGHAELANYLRQVRQNK